MSDSKKPKQYMPEILEAVNGEGEPSWYFALIDKEKYDDFQKARDQGLVDIKQNDKGGLFVSCNGEKCGQVVDNGDGVPTAEQKDDFVKKHGVPVTAEDDAANDNDPDNNKGQPPVRPDDFKP